MTKEQMLEIFDNGANYTWTLYFFTINKHAKNPYRAYKVKMKDVNMVTNYANNLLRCVKEFQLDKIDNVQEYDGANPNLTCDTLSVTNDLIKDNWNNLVRQISEPSTTELKNKIKGYVVVGQPKNDGGASFSLFKIANPIFNVNDKKSQVYKKNNEELDPFSDDLYRLYLTADFFVVGEDLYTLNYKFEDIFDMEKTLQKLKADSVNEILSLNCFKGDEFKEYITSYSHPKTFITLNKERMDRMKDEGERKKIAETLKITINEACEFENLTNEQSLLLIKYLCYKILKDGESGNLFEVSQAVKLEI